MTWGFTAVAAATVVGAKMGSDAAKGAAQTQAVAAEKAGDVGLEATNLQIAADKEALALQLAAQKETVASQLAADKEALASQLAAQKEAVDKQIAAAQSTVDQTLAAQKAAADAGNAANAAALDKQLAAQKAALDQQLNLQRELYNKQVENLSSFKEAGEKGQSRLMDLLGLSGNTSAPGYGSATSTFKVEGFDPNSLLQDFNKTQMEEDPGYAFRLAEGQKAIERSTAARGGLQSGAALKAAARYGQEMGSQEYQNAYNRFMTTKAAQAQEYGNAFNRFQTERSNQLAPLQSLQAIGQASAAQQAAAAGSLAQGSSQALQGYGAGTSAAYGSYGANAGNIAAQQGAGATSAYGNYGNAATNAYGNYGNAATSAYGNYGSGVSNAYGNYGSGVSNAYGNSAAARSSAYGTGATNAINAITGGANAMAAGQIGSANAYTNALGGLTNLYGMYNQNQLLQSYLNKGSDATIKENIRKIGVLDNGLNLYKFEYQAPYKDTWGHGEHIGVMAQEVEKLIPDAVSTHSDGYKVVNYALIY